MLGIIDPLLLISMLALADVSTKFYVLCKLHWKKILPLYFEVVSL